MPLGFNTPIPAILPAFVGVFEKFGVKLFENILYSIDNLLITGKSTSSELFFQLWEQGEVTGR